MQGGRLWSSSNEHIDNRASPPTQRSKRLVELLPSGRVKDPERWLRLCGNSLESLTGKTIMDYMTNTNMTTLEEIHNEEQYAFLSHGSQDDPIFCYFNKAALDMFQYDPGTEMYHLPSRYSAPSGAARASRQVTIDGTANSVDLGYYYLPPVIRQVKNGDLYEISDILLWNVLDDDGYLVGQAAIYDRAKATWVGNEPRDSPPPPPPPQLPRPTTT